MMSKAYKLKWKRLHPTYAKEYMRSWRRGEKWGIKQSKTVVILGIRVRWRMYG